MSNEEIETRWVEAWDTLLSLSLSRERYDFACMLPDGSVVGVEPALAWLQDSVYAGCAVSVTPTWLFGRPGALLARTGTVPPAPRDDSPL